MVRVDSLYCWFPPRLTDQCVWAWLYQNYWVLHNKGSVWRMGMCCIVVNECDWEVRYHMAMKSSGLALLWKPHPSPSERQRVLRLKRKQFLIDYDNHHLNQVPSALLSSPAVLLLHSFTSPSHLFHPTPGYSAFLAEHRSKPPAYPPSPHPHPLNHTYSHTNAQHTLTWKCNSLNQTHKTKRTDIATCTVNVCVQSARCFLWRGS